MESWNQTFGVLTFWEEAKNCDRGASVGAGGEVIIETRERTPGFFTVKMHPAEMHTAYAFLSRKIAIANLTIKYVLLSSLQR